MEEITIENLLQKAAELHKQKKKWHFHILTPNCRFNKKPEMYSFILENESDSKSFIVYSKKRYLTEGKYLVMLLYGDSILDEKIDPCQSSQVIDQILKKARDCNAKGISWEHHLLFPNCILNAKKGKWINVFEDGTEIIESITDDEPIEDLRKIERLYYSQKR
jgi:hypothetical protein